jgi:hypothetical protein
LLETTDARGADDAIAALAPGATFADLMLELGRYDSPTRATLARAIAVDRWSSRYRYCPICTYALRWAGDAVAKVCANPECEHRHFPRLDPAIIVLVTDGMRARCSVAPRVIRPASIRRSRDSSSRAKTSKRHCGVRFSRKPACASARPAISARKPGPSHAR